MKTNSALLLRFTQLLCVLGLVIGISLTTAVNPVLAQNINGVGINGNSPTDNLTGEVLDGFNPLKLQGDPAVSASLTTPGGIISRALVFAFPIAGLILFVMLVWSGFEILGGATEKKSLDSGKQRATAAVIGFFLLFVSYWLIQLIEVVFGVKIF